MNLSRRRAIGIFAAAALPFPKLARAAPGAAWRGRALGAEADITLRHPDRRRAEAALAACRDEIRRLEKIFSLFRRDSAITRLNRDGRLDPAPAEMIELLAISSHLSALSDGAFDITVQPLWQAYARGGDCRQRAEAVLHLVDWRNVHVDGSTVRLKHPGMAITLNGIAQGYITDRITERLKRFCFEHALVHLGEYRGLGRREDGRPWQVGVVDPTENTLIEQIALGDRAIATSSPKGTLLSCTGPAPSHHLLDPRDGRPVVEWDSVSVIADQAVIADGLSTAIAIAKPALTETLLKEGGGRRAILVTLEGRRLYLESAPG